jgi:hypothetical protein
MRTQKLRRIEDRAYILCPSCRNDSTFPTQTENHTTPKPKANLKMLPSAALIATAALSLASYAQASHWRHFDVEFSRFESNDCHEYKSLELGTGIPIHQEKCHRWDDGKTFVSFTFAWLRHTELEEMSTDKDCALLIYDEDRCEGRLLWVRDRVSLP